MTRSWTPLVLLVAAALCACPSNKSAAPEGSELVSAVRAQLAERERKITSYRFRGQTTDLVSNASLGFRFVYRSPGKMRGETEGEKPHVFVFDGQHLGNLDVGAKKLITYDLSGLPKEKADAFLHEIFAPFAPEGFRAPLLPSGKGVVAQHQHGEADRPEIQLTATVGEIPSQYVFTYRFVEPAMDLVDKQIEGPEVHGRVHVIKQLCDRALGFCFPSEILESRDGNPVARTIVSEIAVNGPVTDAEFVLAVPPGGTEEKKTLGEAAP